MNLPELPESTCFASINKQGDVTSTHKNRDAWRTNPLYNADQMRAYALQAVEALRPVAMTDAWHEGFSSGVRFAEAHHHITQKEGTP